MTPTATVDRPTGQQSTIRPDLPGWAQLHPTEDERVPACQWPRWLDTVRWMLTDPQVHALRQAVALPTRRYRIEFDPCDMVPADGALLADDLDLPLQGVEPVSRGRDPERFNHRRYFGRSSTALDIGHSVFEQVGMIDEQGRWRLVDLAPLPARTISAWFTDRRGRLERVEQHHVTPPIRLPAERLVVNTWMGEVGNPLGESMIRPLYRPVVMKDRLVRLDTVKHERNSMGIPVGWVTEDNSPDDAEKMDQILAGMAAGEDAFIRLRAGQDFKLRGVEGQTSDVVASMKFHNEEMGRALLAMVLQAGQTGSGTMTSAEQHMGLLEMFHDVIVQWHCDNLTEQVVARWVARNNPEPGAPIGRVVWAREGEAVKQPETFQYDLEYQILTVDERRARIGLEPLPDGRGEGFPESAEVVARLRLGGEAAALAVADLNGRRAKLGYGPASAVALTTSSGAGGPAVASARRAGLTGARPARRAALAASLPDRELRREPYGHELAAETDFAQLESDWTTAYDDVTAGLLDVRAQLMQAALDAIGDLDTVDPLALGDLLAPILAAHGADITLDALVAALETAAQAGVDQVVGEVDRQGGSVDVADVDYAERAGVEATAAVGRLARAIADSAAGAAQVGVPVGAEGSAVADAVSAHFDGLTSAQVEQQAAGATSRAQMAGRTHALGVADYQEIYASALLDANTCGECIEWDGHVFDDLESATEQFPGGGNKGCEGRDRCRCVLVGVLASEQERVT